MSREKKFANEKILGLEKVLGFANENFLGLKKFLGFSNENSFGVEKFSTKTRCDSVRRLTESFSKSLSNT